MFFLSWLGDQIAGLIDWTKILAWIIGAFRWCGAQICNLLYNLIAWLFQVFMTMSRLDILSVDEIKPIYERVTLILGIIMLFYVTYEFLKYILQPDEISDKERGVGSLIYRLVVVIMLIAFVPKLFSLAHNIQGKILNSGVLSQVMLGKNNKNFKRMGGEFSSSILELFYKMSDDICIYNDDGELEDVIVDSVVPDGGTFSILFDCMGADSCGEVLEKIEDSLDDACETHFDIVYDNTKRLNKGRKVNIAEGITNFEIGKGDKISWYIEFQGLWAIIIGCFILYTLFLYCVDLGVRYAQLVFLQIISPIAAVGYLSPKKDNIFNKWLKGCITTYLDLFIRLGILYGIILMISVLKNSFESGNLFNTLGNVESDVKWIVYVFLCMGLCLFLTKISSLLKELFPQNSVFSGNLGLKHGDRFSPLASKALGLGLGGATGLAVGAIPRTINKHRRNKANGTAGFGKEARQKRKEQRVARRANRKQQGEATRDNRNAQIVSARREKYDQKVADQIVKVKDAKEALDRIAADPNASKEARERAEARLQQEASTYRALVNKREGTDTQKAALGRNVQDARRNVTTAQQELAAARQTGNQAQIQAAQQKLNTAESTLKEATDKYTGHVQRHTSGGTGETRASLMDAKEQSDAAKRGVTEAQAKVDEAQKVVDDLKANNASTEEIIAAEQKVKEAKNGVATATATAEEAEANLAKQKDRFTTVRTGDIATTTRNLETANQQIAKDRNERYENMFGSMVAGAIGGAIRGGITGAQVTKLEEVFPKAVKEGWQKEVKRAREMEQYLDNGGATGIRGVVDRTVAKVEKAIGIDTEYDRTMKSTKPIEQNIKELDAQIDLAKDVTSTIGEAEDRAKSKVYDLQTPVTAVDKDGNLVARKIKTGIAANGGVADVTDCATLGEVVRKYDAQAEVAKNEAESATRRLDEARAIAATGGAAVPAGLEQEVSEKAVAAQQAKYAAEQVRKNAARDEITQILQHPNPEKPEEGTKHFDQGTVQKINTLRRSLQLAASNPELSARIKDELHNIFGVSEGMRLYNAFVTDNIMTYDDLDDINTAYLNVTSAYERDKKAAAERKREIETGAVAQAQKAAQDWNDSGK